MKSFKGKDRSLYVLLIKNYIIYTLVMVVLMMLIYFGRVFVEKTIIQPPKMNRTLGGRELLESGEYESLTLKKLLGSSCLYCLSAEIGCMSLLLPATLHQKLPPSCLHLSPASTNF